MANEPLQLTPYARSLGIAVETMEDGVPVLRAGGEEIIEGRPGVYHGGAISGLLETAGYAALLLGWVEMVGQGYVNPHLGEFGHNFHEVFPYLVMILFLMVRPYGLFGTRDVERV